MYTSLVFWSNLKLDDVALLVADTANDDSTTDADTHPISDIIINLILPLSRCSLEVAMSMDMLIVIPSVGNQNWETWRFLVNESIPPFIKKFFFPRGFEEFLFFLVNVKEKEKA